jgi:hypothetical protein
MRFRNIMEYVQETPGNTNPVILKQMVDEYVVTQNNELAAYTIDADIEDSVDLLGKKASDLQKGVFIVDGKVFGTLKYVTGYTGFSGRADEQEGYYLALHYACEDADSIKVNGVTLDEDGLHILIIKKMGGKVKVEVSKDEETFSEYIDISALKYE